VTEIIHLTGDPSLLEQRPPNSFEQKDLPSQSSTRLLERNVSPIEPAANEMRYTVVQHLAKQVLDAITRDRIDVD
jgi:hypothetical protein